jgi:hypothetical protein
MNFPLCFLSEFTNVYTRFKTFHEVSLQFTGVFEPPALLPTFLSQSVACCLSPGSPLLTLQKGRSRNSVLLASAPSSCSSDWSDFILLSHIRQALSSQPFQHSREVVSVSLMTEEVHYFETSSHLRGAETQQKVCKCRVLLAGLQMFIMPYLSHCAVGWPELHSAVPGSVPGPKLRGCLCAVRPCVIHVYSQLSSCATVQSVLLWLLKAIIDTNCWSACVYVPSKHFFNQLTCFHSCADLPIFSRPYWRQLNARWIPSSGLS